MKYIQYLILIAVASLCFIFIDNVCALSTKQVDISQVGNASQALYKNNEWLGTNAFFSSSSRFADYDFSYIYIDGQYYNFTFSYRLMWNNVPASQIKGYDRVSFITGYGTGYINTMQYSITNSSTGKTSGYVPCTAISLPSAGEQTGLSFTAFTCSFDKNLIEDNQNYNIDVYSYATNNYPTSYDGDLVLNNQPIIYFGRYASFYTDGDTSVVESIKEQTDAINKQTEATKEQTDTIKDNDTSEAQDSAGGFFSGFNDTDHGGLSSLITAPLSLVQKATDKCTTLNLTMFDKDIPIPCGDDLFWSKPEVASFRVIWNCIVGGAALFLILSKVFKVVENLKDPEHDKVEVMKL